MDCAALIESGDWTALIERGTLGTLAMHLEEAIDRAALREKQVPILRAVLGPRVRLDGLVALGLRPKGSGPSNL